MRKILLAIALIFWVGLILFLSFQSGPDTAAASSGLTEWILQFFIEGEIPYETLRHWHMLFRLWAHPVLFFFYGMLAMGVTTGFMNRYSVCLFVSAASGMVLAVFSETGKWNIPGRHCDLEEMVLNIIGVLVGIFFMLAVRLIRSWAALRKESGI